MIARPLVLLTLVLACSCGREAGPPPPVEAAGAPGPGTEPADAARAAAGKGKAEPFASPVLKPPPPPEGAALLPDRTRPIYVQRCDPDHPCPDLLPPAGETPCRGLELGGFTHWRLPDRDEVKRFGELAELELAEGFHWTRTAFAEDAAQAWIVDPKSGQETTIPRTRKPFRVRCVIEP